MSFKARFLGNYHINLKFVLQHYNLKIYGKHIFLSNSFYFRAMAIFSEFFSETIIIIFKLSESYRSLTCKKSDTTHKNSTHNSQTSWCLNNFINVVICKIFLSCYLSIRDHRRGMNCVGRWNYLILLTTLHVFICKAFIFLCTFLLLYTNLRTIISCYSKIMEIFFGFSCEIYFCR